LCLLFFSPLVTSNAYLLEPFFAQLLGYMLGLDKLPGLMTAVGTVFAIAGIMNIDKGSKERLADRKKMLVIKADPLHSTNGDFDGGLLNNTFGDNIGMNSVIYGNDSRVQMSDLNISHLSGR
jgi:hypothetical protein